MKQSLLELKFNDPKSSTESSLLLSLFLSLLLMLSHGRMPCLTSAVADQCQRFVADNLAGCGITRRYTETKSVGPQPSARWHNIFQHSEFKFWWGMDGLLSQYRKSEEVMGPVESQTRGGYADEDCSSLHYNEGFAFLVFTDNYRKIRPD